MLGLKLICVSKKGPNCVFNEICRWLTGLLQHQVYLCDQVHYPCTSTIFTTIRSNAFFHNISAILVFTYITSVHIHINDNCIWWGVTKVHLDDCIASKGALLQYPGFCVLTNMPSVLHNIYTYTLIFNGHICACLPHFGWLLEEARQIMHFIFYGMIK